jgi:hypothetical protein
MHCIYISKTWICFHFRNYFLHFQKKKGKKIALIISQHVKPISACYMHLSSLHLRYCVKCTVTNLRFSNCFTELQCLVFQNRNNEFCIIILLYFIHSPYSSPPNYGLEVDSASIIRWQDENLLCWAPWLS